MINVIKTIVFFSLLLNTYSSIYASTQCPDLGTQACKVRYLDDYLLDSDCDGLSDHHERVCETDRCSVDSDNNGVSDSVQFLFIPAFGHMENPEAYCLDLTPKECPDNEPVDPNLDSDGDGLLDHEEYNMCIEEFGPDFQAHLSADSDGDGIGDAVEVEFNSNPCDASSEIILEGGSQRLITSLKEHSFENLNQASGCQSTKPSQTLAMLLLLILAAIGIKNRSHSEKL